jgi:uncharacterized protein (UPF0332 family)
MTPDDLIQLAGNLAVNPRLGEGEARFRSAISRAYYGAYHLAAALLQELQIPVRRNQTGHQQVYRCLFGCGHPNAVLAAQLLDELRSERNGADYDLSDKRFAQQRLAEDCVKKAHEVRTAIEVCRQPAHRAALEQGLLAVKPKPGL